MNPDSLLIYYQSNKDVILQAFHLADRKKAILDAISYVSELDVQSVGMKIGQGEHWDTWTPLKKQTALVELAKLL